MGIKNILVGLCGIWALGIGARMCYELLLDRQKYGELSGGFIVFQSSLLVDFVPLFALGLFVVTSGVYDYLRDVREGCLGEVVAHEL